jgi:tetratricopeptide (TPR) repeat protein
MIKSLLSRLSILSAIALVSIPVVATAAPTDPTPVATEPPASVPSPAATAPPTIASLDATLKQHPEDLDARLQRGILHAQRSQNIPAMVDYTEVIRLDPNNALAYNNRAAVKVNMRDYWGAYLDYTQVVRIQPDKAITYNNRAYARHRLGDCKGAIADLRIAAELFRLQGDPVNYQRALANLKVFQRKW